MATELSERNLRQLALMKRRLLQFERRELELGTLVGDLDFLIEALESVDPGWKDALREKWGALEQAYALILDQGPQPDDKEFIEEAVERLKQLIEAAESEG